MDGLVQEVANSDYQTFNVAKWKTVQFAFYTTNTIVKIDSQQ